METSLHIGVIGTGTIGLTHIERIQTRLRGGKVVAVSDVAAAPGRRAAETCGGEFFADRLKLIASPLVEAVLVATSDAFHELYVLAAIQAGKPVFCEKPLAPKKDAVRRILDAEMAGGRHLVQVGFMRRYDAGYREMKRLIDARTYGAPLMLHCAHRNYSVGADYHTPMAVENSMIHEIDVLRWMLDEEYATAEVVFPKKTKYAGPDLQDPQIMILTTRSGVRIDVEAFVHCHYGYDIKCEVCCEDGIIHLPDPAFPMVRTQAARVTPICRDWSDRFVDAYNVQIQEWINGTRAGRVDGPSAWDGYAGAVTAEAAGRARDTQTRVRVELEPRPDFYRN